MRRAFKICQKNIRLVSSYASRNAAAASLQVGYHYINQSAQSQSPSTLTPTRGLPPPVINQKCMSAQCVAQPIHDMEVPRSQKHKGKRKKHQKKMERLGPLPPPPTPLHYSLVVRGCRSVGFVRSFVSRSRGCGLAAALLGFRARGSNSWP